MNKSDLNKFVTGSEEKAGAMIFKTGAPLDDRTAVRCKAALISQSALGEVDKDTKKATNKKGWLFNGLITADCQTGEVYVLQNIDALELLTDEAILALSSAEIDEKVEKAWKKAASSSDVSSLSGVFTFKGLAESVSPDLSYIVVCSPSADGREAGPIGTFSDLAGNIYYGWENENGDVFYTDSLVLNGLTQQYNRGSDTYEMRSLEYNGDMYYLTTASPIADDDEQQAYENVSGEMIYINSAYLDFDNGAYIGEVADQEGVAIGTAIGYVYNAYTFTEAIDPIPVTHAHTIITASASNSGHVYQIGENEYASNRQIWVKLGSPVEDWIIL